MAPSVRVLNLVAVMCESILVGVFAVLTVLVVWILSSRQMPRMHKVLFWASILMFLIAVAHLALVVQQIAVVKISQGNSRTRIVLATFQFIISDLVLIWRVWVVWAHNYWVALGPLIIMLVAAGFSFNSVGRNPSEITRFFVVAPSALVMANTTICTLLIAGRIWYTRYKVRQIAGGKMYAAGGFSGTIALFIETGALYAATQIVALTLDNINNPGIHILLDLQIPMIGILPTLIIVFVHFELVGSIGQPNSNVPFEGRSRIVQLSTFVASTVHSEETSKTTKENDLSVV